MSQPRSSSDRFSHQDLAVVGDLTKRAVQHIADARLLPQDEDGGNASDFRALKRIAVVGSFVAAGVPLMAAGQIAEALFLEFNQPDGEAPSGLQNLWRKLPREELRALAERNDYGLHQALRRHLAIYEPGKSMGNDFVVEIADHEFVFTRTLKGKPEPSGRLENWRRGAVASFVHLTEELTICGDDSAEAAAWRERQQQMMAARANAVGLIIVNLSLAIRNGLDRLAERRERSKP